MVRHLTEDLGEMNCLQKLEYADFPQACMPRSFPQSLQEIELRPCDWFLDLPRGLKELHQLHSLQFDSDCESWEIRRPLSRAPSRGQALEIAPWLSRVRLHKSKGLAI